jgi:YD repeat-containing protein
MQYDANSRLTNMVDAAGTSRFTYTDFGALLSEDGPWDNDTVTYGYTTTDCAAS